ncbi:cryptochrome/photolyase family protein [Romeria aff. gracilis LEGE 07310]|uniref:Cryptochrome/photolyase family protein n=1 Tax=Vasconcelosia minhoensis LEGE 07310 TaxID=915328 RepID=A0A8J7A5H0_9CYAN|nr:cryptochrome/photolyase family protein [Romeria gracilis]MBE9076772.1 cryptochrome/photolyase family protein [Romeria aff. gracilis LEGE 07310]
MTTGIWVLGDQLWTGQAALESCANRKSKMPVILIESLEQVRRRPYHQQKLILVWSAMRHFAAELRAEGWPVTYEMAEDFATPLTNWIEQQGIQELRVMAPTDRPFAEFLAELSLPCKLTLRPNNQYLWSREAFAGWAKSRKSLLMETFYREGRRRFQVLMEGEQPVGGQWNFDKQNRRPPKGKIEPPEPLWFEPDSVTRDVTDWVNGLDLKTFGEAEPFRWGVTRSQALEVLEHFIQVRLRTFGPYQDAMVTGAETLWHALLSPYLNLGLLHPLEVIEAVEQAYHEDDLPINSVEGFIRQVLGWREYMHGIYHHVKADYPERNFFEHTQPLPDFFWTADTPMNCLHQTLDTVRRTGYAHHIQRLMVLSNFALIAGLSPQAVEDWFHAAFIDAYDWVMQTNVIGMGLFADGGVLATKPYASSANYINRMSDYCQGCQYNRKARTGDDACPFNFFYWDFLARHRDKLGSQGRMNFILANLDRLSEEELNEIHQRAVDWHQPQ